MSASYIQSSDEANYIKTGLSLLNNECKFSCEICFNTSFDYSVVLHA